MVVVMISWLADLKEQETVFPSVDKDTQLVLLLGLFLGQRVVNVQGDAAPWVAQRKERSQDGHNIQVLGDPVNQVLHMPTKHVHVQYNIACCWHTQTQTHTYTPKKKEKSIH